MPFSEKEIDGLIELHGFDFSYSWFTGKPLEGVESWVRDLPRFMDAQSVSALKLKLFPKFCAFCGITLDVENCKYCTSCIANHVWSTSKKNGGMVSEERLAKRGNKAKPGIRKFYRSAKGKQVIHDNKLKRSASLKKYFLTPEGKIQIEKSRSFNSDYMKDMIRTGRFSPNITNSYTHWDAFIKDGDAIVKFRSSWEACFWCSNKSLEYETVRIPYSDSDGIMHTYVADFFDSKTNTVYEIKPTSQWRKTSCQRKMKAAALYCARNEIQLVWVNENNIMDYVDKSDFTADNMPQFDKMLEGVTCRKKAK